jgi:hypothetical protein
VCSECGKNLSVKKCYICPNPIDVKIQAVEAGAPLQIGGSGVMEVPTPEAAYSKMIKELVKYQEFFANPVKETFISLSNGALSHIL